MSQLKYQPSLGETKVHPLIREQQRQFKSPAPQAWVGTGGNPDNEPSDDDDGKYESPLQSGGHPNILYNAQSDNRQFNAGGASNRAKHPVIASQEPNALGIDYARHVACQTQAGHAQQAYPAVPPVPLRR